MSREAMKLALEALEEINKLSIGENAICLPAEIDGAMDALRERLAQPEQEPVWIQPNHLQKARQAPFLCRVEPAKRDDFVPLYTTPPQRQWQGLTDEEINSVRHKRDWTAPWTDTTFAKAIEAKLKEKNHG